MNTTGISRSSKFDEPMRRLRKSANFSLPDVVRLLEAVKIRNYARPKIFNLQDISSSVQNLSPKKASLDTNLWLKGLFGPEPKKVGHGAKEQSPIAFGEPQTEPRITRRLAHFLSPWASESYGGLRLITFLNALECARQEVCHSGDDAGARRSHRWDVDNYRHFQVTAEYVAIDSMGSDRIDIWIELLRKNSAEIEVIVVEAKIGADEQLNQTSRYRELAEHRHSCSDNKGGFDKPSLYFVTPSGRSAASKGWAPVCWIALLREWEMRLAKSSPRIDDDDFRRFRRDMWTHCI